MKIIPAIDIIEGKTVRLEKGRYEDKLSYAMDPVDAAREWELMGAELLHVVDLDGAKAGEPVNLYVMEQITRAVSIPVQVGGGFRKESDIKKALDKGIWRVIVGSKALVEVDFARDIIDVFKERVILSVDADRGEVKVDGWTRSIDVDLGQAIDRFISFGAREMIYTDISKDGTLMGPDIPLLRKIFERHSAGFIYAGGVRTVEHLIELKELEKVGLTGVIVGRALYDGTLDLREAIHACEADNPLS
jgi:phosphoribosylformimino-5-aminoimidazole carboxamide ribotide isomerase